MEDISVNIKKVLLVFLICFIGVISYITYFEIQVGPKIVKSSYNRRMIAIRNEVLRGTIYDRNMVALTDSKRVDTETQKREYTGGEIFSHVLGYMDIKYGITGLEKKYDDDLMKNEEDNLFTYLLKKKNHEAVDEEKIGRGLKTTLDSNLQKQAFNLLGNNKGAVVALNPKTGELLAMVSKPAFNPNNLMDDWDYLNSKDADAPLINRATAGLYPPGSTFKTITAISALENIKDIMNRRIDDDGKLVFNSKESLSNFNGEVLGNIGFKEAFFHSSNVYFGKLGMELGNDKLKATAEKFYFNKNIPADGITIENSRFPTLKKNEQGNIAQSAIGQSSVLVTPMQMALVASTIANDGIMMRPYLVDEVISPKGETIRKIDPQSDGNIVSKENAKTMKDFMRAVVTDGTGVGAYIDGISVCGKTGTADHDNNGTPHAWFIGFAPYENPQIAIAVLVENGGQGGIKAASIAKEIIKTAVKK